MIFLASCADTISPTDKTQPACDIKDKGNSLLRNSRPVLAISKYQIALERVEAADDTYLEVQERFWRQQSYDTILTGKFAGHSIYYALEELKIDIQSRLAVAALKIGDYQETCMQTDSIEDCSCWYSYAKSWPLLFSHTCLWTETTGTTC